MGWATHDAWKEAHRRVMAVALARRADHAASLHLLREPNWRLGQGDSEFAMPKAGHPDWVFADRQRSKTPTVDTTPLLIVNLKREGHHAGSCHLELGVQVESVRHKSRSGFCGRIHIHQMCTLNPRHRQAYVPVSSNWAKRNSGATIGEPSRTFSWWATTHLAQ